LKRILNKASVLKDPNRDKLFKKITFIRKMVGPLRYGEPVTTNTFKP